MDKDTLRNKLFEKYFEVNDGVVAKDLADKLSFIKEIWKELHVLCEKNIKYFDKYSRLSAIKILEHNKNKYLITKLDICNYVIIDLNKMDNISNEQLKSEFNEEFFIRNFNERKVTSNGNFYDFYDVTNYDGNKHELFDFYVENQDIFNLSSRIDYTIKIDNALTYFIINFAVGSAQLGFQTPDQFLYEQLFLGYDLTASRMQDAGRQIGVEKMKEMFERIPTIKIPKDYIPKELYEQYLAHSNIAGKQDIKNKLLKKPCKK